MRLRCWAQRERGGEFCCTDAGHHDQHESFPDHTGRGWWFREDECAANARSNGRKTAALRILEVSHEIDRLAFLAGEHDEMAGWLRAIAARLLANIDAAKVDVAEIRSTMADTVALFRSTGLPESSACEAKQIVALLDLAADILKPFAGDV